MEGADNPNTSDQNLASDADKAIKPLPDLNTESNPQTTSPPIVTQPAALKEESELKNESPKQHPPRTSPAPDKHTDGSYSPIPKSRSARRDPRRPDGLSNRLEPPINTIAASDTKPAELPPPSQEEREEEPAAAAADDKTNAPQLNHPPSTTINVVPEQQQQQPQQDPKNETQDTEQQPAASGGGEDQEQQQPEAEEEEAPIAAASQPPTRVPEPIVIPEVTEDLFTEAGIQDVRHKVRGQWRKGTKIDDGTMAFLAVTVTPSDARMGRMRPPRPWYDSFMGGAKVTKQGSFHAYSPALDTTFTLGVTAYDYAASEYYIQGSGTKDLFKKLAIAGGDALKFIYTGIEETTGKPMTEVTLIRAANNPHAALILQSAGAREAKRLANPPRRPEPGSVVRAKGGYSGKRRKRHDYDSELDEYEDGEYDFDHGESYWASNDDPVWDPTAGDGGGGRGGRKRRATAGKRRYNPDFVDDIDEYEEMDKEEDSKDTDQRRMEEEDLYQKDELERIELERFLRGGVPVQQNVGSTDANAAKVVSLNGSNGNNGGGSGPVKAPSSSQQEQQKQQQPVVVPPQPQVKSYKLGRHVLRVAVPSADTAAGEGNLPASNNVNGTSDHGVASPGAAAAGDTLAMLAGVVDNIDHTVPNGSTVPEKSKPPAKENEIKKECSLPETQKQENNDEPKQQQESSSPKKAEDSKPPLQPEQAQQPSPQLNKRPPAAVMSKSKTRNSEGQCTGAKLVVQYEQGSRTASDVSAAFSKYGLSAYEGIAEVDEFVLQPETGTVNVALFLSRAGDIEGLEKAIAGLLELI